MPDTHEVENQPPPLESYDLLGRDLALTEALAREGAGWALDELRAFGRKLTEPEVQKWGFQANRYGPELKTHDRFGNRIDEVEFHPAWHSLMSLSCGMGLQGRPWAEPRVGAHVARAAGSLLAGQIEFGHLCPISMTYSAFPPLQRDAKLAAEWGPRITARGYDPRLVPASEKKTALIGMAMTEKQGGSDVRANTTRAQPIADGAYLITGHKWFCSAPMSDAFLTLAQTASGLTCFLLPRFTPDGKRNRFFIQRLKDKLGNRSNASSEIELDQAWAQRLGEEGRGVPTILEMANHTRLDCVVGSTAMMRQALTQAVHHARHRKAFGKLLGDQPLMRNVLADLALEAEAATVLAMRLARAYDRRDDEGETAFRRLATAVSKFWVCKRAEHASAEALECLGGNGFVEENVLARVYREAPVNSVWEGSGNVICLDVLRALTREPRTLDALIAELGLSRGADRRLDAHLDGLEAQLTKLTDAEPRARRLVEQIALGLQGALLVRHAPSATADAFCASRLAGDAGFTLGTLPAAADLGAILERAWPA